ncbi:acyltransferase family protein [Collinsella sp. AGMB00827]|uniref:Acyltransferase family protein n=1 Tax=Collinsella ureilytica TaxID=2869515 RepID=A0ABS7MI92_9ACTN|nr:acyltransferase family protein [Collinsella urealyticum]MBY4797088.1 acyltransferase family protein [Collinsella urealyticum]
MQSRGTVFSWTYPFGGFIFFFLIGPFVEELFSNKRARIALWILTPLCVAATTWLVIHGYSSHGQGAFDNSPLYAIAALGIYLGLLEIGDRIHARYIVQVIGFVARHSFTVYLVHLHVLDYLKGFFPSVSGLAAIGAHLGLTLATIGLSLAIALIIDTILVHPAQRLFDLAHSLFATRHNRAAA